MKKYLRLVVYNIFFVDIWLFFGKIEFVFVKYKLLKKIFEENFNIFKENRRFLVVYINFWIIVIGFYKVGKEFLNWREFLKFINDLEVNRYFKRLFFLLE